MRTLSHYRAMFRASVMRGRSREYALLEVSAAVMRDAGQDERGEMVAMLEKVRAWVPERGAA